MNKVIPFISSIFLVVGCDSHAERSLTQKALKPLIEYQCGQELKASKLWKVSTYFMQEQNKTQLQAEVCDCVGEHALKDVPAQTILKATVNEEAKNQLTRQALSNTLKACISEFVE